MITGLLEGRRTAARILLWALATLILVPLPGRGLGWALGALPPPWLALFAFAAVAFDVALAFQVASGANSALVAVSMLTLLGWCAVSVPFSAGAAHLSTAAFAVYGSIGLAVTVSLQPADSLIALVTLASIEGVLSICMGTWGGTSFYTAGLARLAGTFGYPTRLAFPLALAAPAALGLFLSKGRVWLLPLLILIASLVLTWSRGPILGAASGMVLISLRVGNSASTSTRWTLSALCACMVLLSVLARGWGSGQWQAEVRSSSSRVEAWIAASKQIISHPLGIGPGNILLTVPTEGGMDQTEVSDPKNQLLTDLLAFGVVAGGIATVCYLVGAAGIVSRCNTSEGGTVAGILLSVVILSIFDSPFFVRSHGASCGLLGLLTGLLVKSNGGKGP